VALLFVGRSVCVVVEVLNLLPNWEGLIGEKLLHGHTWRIGLRGRVLLLLLGLSLLLLLGGAFGRSGGGILGFVLGVVAVLFFIAVRGGFAV
jgi:hypothetical protein